MILSVSRRSDIPTFYTEWFFNRLKEGYVLSRNPMNYRQVSKINITPSNVDCIVFWTKDPSKILPELNMLKEYCYYFQITLNGYSQRVERNVPPEDLRIDSFKELSLQIGKEKTIWRYDPIIITDEINIDYHCHKFESLAKRLMGFSDLCIISFVDFYKKTSRNMKRLKPLVIKEKDMVELGMRLSEIAQKYNFKIEACCEPVDLTTLGIAHAKCIDDRLVTKLSGHPVNFQKDKNQRGACGCVTSTDIGVYNTCQHGCLYCYANFNDLEVLNNIAKHDPKSPMLIGNVESGDKVTERVVNTNKKNQLTLF